MNQSRKHLNEVLDFLTLFHGLDADSNSVPNQSLDLPNGLGDLYRKHTKWTNKSNFHVLYWGESLTVSDGMIFGIECPRGWIGFSQERDGVWLAACPASIQDDTEVAICTGSGVVNMPSLNQFLVWLLLQESVWMTEQGTSSERGIDDDDYWSTRGFSDLIDCSFEGGDGCIQLFRNFRLSGDGKTIAQGDTKGSHLSTR